MDWRTTISAKAAAAVIGVYLAYIAVIALLVHFGLIRIVWG